MNEELTLSLAVAFIWYTMSGIVAVRIKRVVSAIDNHLPHKQKKKKSPFSPQLSKFQETKTEKETRNQPISPSSRMDSINQVLQRGHRGIRIRRSRSDFARKRKRHIGGGGDSLDGRWIDQDVILDESDLVWVAHGGAGRRRRVGSMEGIEA